MTNNFENSDRGQSGSTGGSMGGSESTSDLVGAAKSALSDVARTASEDIRAVRGLAQEQVDIATQKTTQVVSEQKTFAAKQIGGIASALEKIGGEMENGETSMIGQYARELGSTLQKFSGDLENRDIRDIASVAEDFGRRQPMAFLGIAAFAGLAASRFLLASSRRTAANRSMGSTTPSYPSSMSTYNPSGSSSTSSSGTSGSSASGSGSSAMSGFNKEDRFNG